MLRLDFGRLARQGSVLVAAEIPGDDSLWEGSGVPWAGPVDVALRASYSGSGEIVVRGGVTGPLEQECRRCLEPVRSGFELDVTMVFVSSDESEGGGAGDARIYDAKASELDLGEAMREELILALDAYVVCDPECKGLCPECGVNRNTGTCSCSREESDPRWEALRTLKEK